MSAETSGCLRSWSHKRNHRTRSNQETNYSAGTWGQIWQWSREMLKGVWKKNTIKTWLVPFKSLWRFKPKKQTKSSQLLLVDPAESRPSTSYRVSYHTTCHTTMLTDALMRELITMQCKKTHRYIVWYNHNGQVKIKYANTTTDFYASSSLSSI